jgi:hypothetical protein
MCFIIQVLLIVLCKVDSYLTPHVFTFRGLKSKLKLKISLNEILVIHINEKTTCHDFHGFKWQNTNIYPILTIFIEIWCPFWFVGLWQHSIIKLIINFNSLINLNMTKKFTLSRYFLYKKCTYIIWTFI